MGQIIDQKIAELIEQSNIIASFVRQENWDKVSQLSQLRQNDLELFFQKPVSQSYTKAVATMIQEILSIDNEMVEFIEKEKKRTFNKFTNIQNNNKVHQIYKNVASLS